MDPTEAIPLAIVPTALADLRTPLGGTLIRVYLILQRHGALCVGGIPMTANELAEELDRSASVASLALKRLRELGMVTVRRVGRQNWYHTVTAWTASQAQGT